MTLKKALWKGIVNKESVATWAENKGLKVDNVLARDNIEFFALLMACGTFCVLVLLFVSAILTEHTKILDFDMGVAPLFISMTTSMFCFWLRERFFRKHRFMTDVAKAYKRFTHLNLRELSLRKPEMHATLLEVLAEISGWSLDEQACLIVRLNAVFDDVVRKSHNDRMVAGRHQELVRSQFDKDYELLDSLGLVQSKEKYFERAESSYR